MVSATSKVRVPTGTVPVACCFSNPVALPRMTFVTGPKCNRGTYGCAEGIEERQGQHRIVCLPGIAAKPAVHVICDQTGVYVALNHRCRTRHGLMSTGKSAVSPTEEQVGAASCGRHRTGVGVERVAAGRPVRHGRETSGRRWPCCHDPASSSCRTYVSEPASKRRSYLRTGIVDQIAAIRYGSSMEVGVKGKQKSEETESHLLEKVSGAFCFKPQVGQVTMIGMVLSTESLFHNRCFSSEPRPLGSGK